MSGTNILRVCASAEETDVGSEGSSDRTSGSSAATPVDVFPVDEEVTSPEEVLSFYVGEDYYGELVV